MPLVFTVLLLRDGINQTVVGIRINPMIVLVQFNGRLFISVVGSKIENRFLSSSIYFVNGNDSFVFYFFIC